MKTEDNHNYPQFVQVAEVLVSESHDSDISVYEYEVEEIPLPHPSMVEPRG